MLLKQIASFGNRLLSLQAYLVQAVYRSFVFTQNNSFNGTILSVVQMTFYLSICLFSVTMDTMIFFKKESVIYEK